MSSQKRFQFLHAFHVVDKDTLPSRQDPAYRPSCKLFPLLKYFNSISIEYFVPKRDLSIDKTLGLVVGSKAHNPIRQFSPNKHYARFVTNIWVLANSETSYIMKLCTRGQNLTNPVELLHRNQLHKMPEQIRNSKPKVC